MMNSVKKHLEQIDHKALSIYFTAGFPKLEDTTTILKALEANKVDFVEIGMPYSDPLADGPTIQASGQKALENGMSVALLLEQLEGFRSYSKIPVVLMGYYNCILQYGMEDFLKHISVLGIDTLILPDLPLDYYEHKYHSLFKKYGVELVFLITPQSSEERIRQIDRISNSFIYMVSSNAITGREGSLSAHQTYYKRIKEMGLENPVMAGFGIHNQTTFEEATAFADGAIIGSAFIKAIQKEGVELGQSIEDFVKTIEK